jgi:hypothetical protein
MSKTSKNLGSSVLITLETKFVDVKREFRVTSLGVKRQQFTTPNSEPQET